VLFSEPKIPQCGGIRFVEYLFAVFQCSSASRKFLNLIRNFCRRFPVRVSVLFSEPKIPQSNPVPARADAAGVSVLFSEPKIPQSRIAASRWRSLRVSVLFSEPKIPQSPRTTTSPAPTQFQCSSASRKFLNRDNCV